ncbi:MAG: hypothetical protein ACK56F_07005, partial [bacterium]
AALRPCIFATPSAKNALLFPLPNNSRIFPDFYSLQLFSPLPNECQLFMPKDFWDLPVLTLPGEPLVLQERVEGGGETDNEPITPNLLPLVPEFINTEFHIYSFCTFKNFC